MNVVPIDGNDITISNIVSKQEYTQNKIKFDARFNAIESHGKIFLIKKEEKTKIVFTNYLFAIKEVLAVKNGVVFFADFKEEKTIFLLGTLDNPLDSKSLLKIEYENDKYYEDNILTFANWIKFFCNTKDNIFVITNSIKKVKLLVESQNLVNYEFKYLKKEDILKINNKIKPSYIREDLISIYLSSIIFVVLAFFTINYIGDAIIASDIENSTKERAAKATELTRKTSELQELKNNEYYQNKEYYLKLAEKKVFKRGNNDKND